jgi:hypothetical protein
MYVPVDPGRSLVAVTCVNVIGGVSPNLRNITHAVSTFEMIGHLKGWAGWPSP